MALQFQYDPDIAEAGLDEAGRGCLAGPVVAGAVILPKGFSHPALNDSKQVSEKKRFELREFIIEHALAWSIGIISHTRIDEINILNASFEAMQEAVNSLSIRPDALLVDGNRFRTRDTSIPWRCEIKGDGRFLNIAAASILAKTFRDEIMETLHEAHPEYGWNSNKGYPTAVHRAAIIAHGPSPWHRMSYQLTPQPTLFDV
jgi:ribonuclease HII